MLRKWLGLLLLAFFLLGLLPSAPGNFNRAGALARKKKIVRRVKKIKVKKAKKIKKAKKARKARKARRAKQAKKTRKVRIKWPVQRPRAKVKKRAAEPAYQLPARTGTVTQRYSLVEGADEAGAGQIVRSLKEIGADEASVDVDNNSLAVTFNTSELSAIGIIKKLKELGYTVKRIN